MSIQVNVRSDQTSRTGKQEITAANMLDKTEIREVEGFHVQSNLSSYTDAFINAGYDDMQQIKDIVASSDKAATEVFARCWTQFETRTQKKICC